MHQLPYIIYFKCIQWLSFVATDEKPISSNFNFYEEMRSTKYVRKSVHNWDVQQTTNVTGMSF